MARIYNFFPAKIPTDATNIYIRILNEYNAPVLAQYDSSSSTFTAVDSGLVYPHYVVLSWRYI
jgi:hypothetical protein